MIVTERNVLLSYLLGLLGMFCVSTLSVASKSDPKSTETNWTGFYAGINGGYSWANANTHILPLPYPNPASFGNVAPTRLPVSMTGGVLGGQIGYNWQLRSHPELVIGLEADMNWIPLNGSAIGNGVGVGSKSGLTLSNIFSTQQKMTWFGTLRPRLGFISIDSLLFYATGGLAYGNIKEMANLDFVTNAYGTHQYPFSKTVIRSGWTAGGGVEWAPHPRWSAKIEYLYYNLGSTAAIANGVPLNPPFQNKYTWTNPPQLVRLGVNYHFDLV